MLATLAFDTDGVSGPRKRDRGEDDIRAITDSTFISLTRVGTEVGG